MLARRAEHLDAASLERLLGSLLVAYPEAPVAAMLASGVMVGMPDSVPLVRNPVLSARSGLDLLVEQDRVAVLGIWDAILANGAGRCRVRLAGDPQAPVVYHGFDLRACHGVLIAVFVPADGSDGLAVAVDAGEAADPPPRFAAMHKDQHSFIIETDSALSRILDWSVEEMTGRRSLEFIHPDDHPLALDNWMQMLAHPGPARRVRLRHRRRDGGWVWFEVTNHNLLEDVDHRCVVSEMVDISDEMAVQEALSAREQLLARIAETIPVGLFQIDVEGRITYTNDRLHEIVAVNRAPTVMAQFATIVDTVRPALGKALDRVLHAGLDADIEVELRASPDRQLRYCTIGLRALRHDDGTISGAIGCVADVTDGVRMREELTKRATFDELTGCYNRASIMRALETHIASAGDGGERAVMFVDLDQFKAINDQHGHVVGDELLRRVASRLRAALRGDDLVGRIGGDEFLVMCPNIGGPGEAIQLAERLADAIRRDRPLLSDIEPRVSIGVAWSKGHEPGAEALVVQADRAMYESKNEAAGRPRLATPNTNWPRPTLRSTAAATPEDRAARTQERSERTRPLPDGA